MLRRIAISWAMGLSLAAAPALAQERSAHTNYILRCVGCHGFDGMGSKVGGVPAFPGSIGALARSGDGRTYLLHVPGVVNSSLTNAEIAQVMNFILDRWSEGAPKFDTAEVDRRRATPVPDIVAMRREIGTELQREGVFLAQYPWP